MRRRSTPSASGWPRREAKLADAAIDRAAIEGTVERGDRAGSRSSTRRWSWRADAGGPEYRAREGRRRQRASISSRRRPSVNELTAPDCRGTRRRTAGPRKARRGASRRRTGDGGAGQVADRDGAGAGEGVAGRGGHDAGAARQRALGSVADDARRAGQRHDGQRHAASRASSSPACRSTRS